MAKQHRHPKGEQGFDPSGRGRLPAAILAAMLVLCALMALTAAWPKLDLALALGFYAGEGKGFALRFDKTLILLRNIGYYLPIAVLLVAFLAWAAGKRMPRPGVKVTGRSILFLALSFALGPGLAVNGVLKEISHRPRPTQVVEFGGKSPFRPWYSIDGACEHNCSFASGEVAGASWLLAPAALAPPPWRAVAITASSVFTIAVAVLRMAFGGHFASDVVAAVLLTYASIFAVGFMILRWGARPRL
jgi:membrane-associated PAP2 superfamily phosphatase